MTKTIKTTETRKMKIFIALLLSTGLFAANAEAETVRMASENFVSNAIANIADDVARSFATTIVVRTAPVELTAGQTDVDTHNDSHNAPVEIGVGAKATVDTTNVDASAASTAIRSVSVAIGPGADATDPDNPRKQQAIAIGNQSRAKGVNAIAIGSGVRHDDETNDNGGNAYAEGAQSIAIGYSSKAKASKAIQLGPGVNDVENSFKVNDVWVVKGGKFAIPDAEVSAAASNAVHSILDNKVPQLTQKPVSNGYAEVRLTAYNGIDDTDHMLWIAVNTNKTETHAYMQVSSGPRLELYKAETIDSITNDLWTAIQDLMSHLDLY